MRLVIDVLDAGLLAQPGIAQPGGKPLVAAMSELAIDQRRKPVGMSGGFVESFELGKRLGGTVRNFVRRLGMIGGRSPTMPRRKDPRIPDAVLDQLLAGADPKTVFDPNGLLDDLKKALAERVLNAEMDHHLAGEEPGNRRNGYGKKTVITDTGRIELEVPRDRQARFDPQLFAKYQRRLPGFDDKIISMYPAA